MIPKMLNVKKMWPVSGVEFILNHIFGRKVDLDEKRKENLIKMNFVKITRKPLTKTNRHNNIVPEIITQLI